MSRAPPAQQYQSAADSVLFVSPYQSTSARQSSTTPQYQLLQLQHSSTTPQRYASAPSSQQPTYPPGIAPPATYGSSLYQSPYQPLPIQENSTRPQRYASAPSSHQPIYPLGSAPQTTYNSNPYQPQHQSPPVQEPSTVTSSFQYSASLQKPSAVPSSFEYSTPLQNPSTVPSNYQNPLQSSLNSAPQPHASSTVYQPVASSYDALADGPPFAVGAPISGVPGLPNIAQPDPQPGSTFQTPQQASHLQATVPIEPQQLAATADQLALVVVQDGEEPQSFSSPKLITSYLRLFPEAENDQGCRIFKYGPKCSSKLLLPLFEHFEFPRYALFPYGFANDFVAERTLNAGICRCQRCTDDRPCGHYVLQHHFQFYLFQNTAQPLISMPPKVAADSTSVVISSRSSQYKFFMADWNLQVFRFRSHRIETTEFAYDALIYQNYESATRLRSSPLDYLLSQVDIILTNWDVIINASSEFLSSFRFEVLEERLETDRTIIRHLLQAAQQWERFRKELQNQLQSLEVLENIHSDPRWTEGRDDLFQLQAVSAGYIQRFRAVEYRIATDLIQETDSLIQRVTNLISIDEGYRSRDQNQSIRRLTWITFIFLPLVFTAGIFGMNVDLFRGLPPWRYYFYCSIVVVTVVFMGYVLLRSRRRATRVVAMLTKALLSPVIKLVSLLQKTHGDDEVNIGIEEQEISSVYEVSTVLKWAASSGRTDIVRRILQDSSKAEKNTLAPVQSGQALLVSIKNGHEEAATLLIEAGEGLFYVDGDHATLLHYAARAGQSTIIKLLLEKGLSLNSKDKDGRTALDYATAGNDELTINLLLKGGKESNRQETANIQSLHFGARSGDLELIKQLHKQRSSLEARDGKGQTVLFHAVKGKQQGVVKWLLDHEANVQAIDKEGFTPLHAAAQISHLKIAELLVSHGADVNALSVQNLTPLLCIAHSEGVPVLRFFHSKGANVHATDKDNNGITHKAALRGDAAALLLKIVRDLGADMRAAGGQGNTPAHLAAESGSVSILDILSPKDASIYDLRNIWGYTPLMVASHAGKLDAMRYMLKKGVPHDVADASGRPLVQLTTEWGNPAVMQVLQEFGADFKNFATTADNAHPIWKAIHDGHLASVERILDSGLSIEYKHEGVSLLQLAAEVGNADIVRRLLERDATVNAADNHGWTPLHSAAYSGNIEFVLSILQKGGSKEALDAEGWTPLDLAAFYKYDDIVTILDPGGRVEEFAWMRAKQNKLAGLSFHTPPIADSVIPGSAEAPPGQKDASDRSIP